MSLLAQRSLNLWSIQRTKHQHPTEQLAGMCQAGSTHALNSHRCHSPIPGRYRQPHTAQDQRQPGASPYPHPSQTNRGAAQGNQGRRLSNSSQRLRPSAMCCTRTLPLGSPDRSQQQAGNHCAHNGTVCTQSAAPGMASCADGPATDANMSGPALFQATTAEGSCMRQSTLSNAVGIHAHCGQCKHDTTRQASN